MNYFSTLVKLKDIRFRCPLLRPGKPPVPPIAATERLRVGKNLTRSFICCDAIDDDEDVVVVTIDEDT